MRVLVVGEETVSRCALLEMLSACGMQTITVENLAPALAAVSQAALDDRPFALVILDTGTSDGRALERVESLVAQGTVSGIIVLTPKPDLKEAERYYAKGATAYLQWPIAPSELREAITTTLGSESLKRLGAFAASVPENTSIIIKESAAEIAIDGFAFNGAMFDGDIELLVEIVTLFLETYSQLLSDVECAISRKDATDLCRAAHTLKGAVANFGAKALVEQAGALEMMGKDGDLASAVEGGCALRALMEAFEPELQTARKKAMEQVVT